MTLTVSAELFELVIECLKLSSKARQEVISLDELVSELLAPAHVIDSIDFASARDHLAAQPAHGPIALPLVVFEDERRAFTNLRAIASQRTELELAPEDTLSILLFSYLVERTAARVMTGLAARLGASSPSPPEVGLPSNIVPLERRCR